MRTERANTLYASLADDIAALIAAGTLRPGDRLPSLRELRDKRGVSLSTVTEAFHLLEDRGLIEARPQSGFYVRRRPVEPPPPSRPSQEPAAVTVNRRLWDYLQLTRGRQHGFCYAVLAPECFPNAQLQRLMNEALRESPNLLSEYGGTRGLEVLRRQVARHAMEWGGRLTADDVQITAGGIEALNLALRAVTQPGDVVAVESPTYFGLLQLFESMGLKALEIPTDPEHGISLAALELATRDDAVAACVLMPNFSNPTGSLMSDEAKQQLVRLLAERGVPLIEDDIYGDFHQGRERPRPAKAFDETGNVLYVASYTKVVAPGMRVGWIAPGRYRARVEILKYINTFSTPAITQATLARFLESGGYDQHMRRLRRLCSDQLARLNDGLARYFPAGTRWTRPHGGYMCWVELPAGADATRILQSSVQDGISFAPGPLFSARDAYRNYLRLCCGEPWSAAVEAKLRRLGELVQRDLDGGRRVGAASAPVLLLG
ncbi:aminotransferase-like domain-containing protein [Chitinimonas koreensis]|uniref:aminotransferase-like domain-containing protein n=1 Tax=Chitinimonas koreensis TaxID=356302 RepID=UPI0006869967|nr:PLP-dependent aminotransferase family protein [Chitinimonas koreensis]